MIFQLSVTSCPMYYAGPLKSLSTGADSHEKRRTLKIESGTARFRFHYLTTKPHRSPQGFVHAANLQPTLNWFIKFSFKCRRYFRAGYFETDERMRFDELLRNSCAVYNRPGVILQFYYARDTYILGLTLRQRDLKQLQKHRSRPACAVRAGWTGSKLFACSQFFCLSRKQFTS